MKKIINFKEKKEERFTYLFMELLADETLHAEDKTEYFQKLEKDYENFLKFYKKKLKSA
jgi:hypothetical protein